MAQKNDELMRQQNPNWLEASLLQAQDGDVLELDEVWSFVQSKKKVVWLWFAQCRRTRQIVAWMPGTRSYLTCRQLWRKIPESYRQGTCFTDFWEAYCKVIPAHQHHAGSKQEGQTNHLERFNCTLRQRVGRLVRKTLSFSKNHLMHLVHIRPFLKQYNHYCIKRFAPADLAPRK